MQRFGGKHIAVTGGGVGIGRAIAERLASEGAAEVQREGFVDRLVDDAADVVGLEDRSVNLHRA